MSDEITWPPQEKNISCKDVDDKKCIIIRYKANDRDLEQRIKAIPYYFGCKYRFMLWMHYLKKDLQRLQCKKVALQNFISKLDEIRRTLETGKMRTSGPGKFSLPRLPDALASTEIRRKHQELSHHLNASSSRRRTVGHRFSMSSQNSWSGGRVEKVKNRGGCR